MKKQIEAELARGLLELRRTGFSVIDQWMQTQLRYFVGPLIFFSATAWTFFIGLDFFGWFLAGLTTGYVLRDFAWIKILGRNWPFREKITDWEKVQEIANSDGIDERHG